MTILVVMFVNDRRNYSDYSNHHFQEYKLHPKSILFIKAINKHELNVPTTYKPKHEPKYKPKRIYDALCGFIAHIKSFCYNWNVAKRNKLSSTASRKNYASFS